MRFWQLCLVGGLAALAACDAPTVPERTGAYAFTLMDGSTERVLHWPLGSTIRVAVVSGSSAAATIGPAVDAGIAAWNASALYGEFRLERVDSVAAADVLVAASDAALPVDVSGCPPGGFGLGITTFCLTTDRSGLIDFPVIGGSGPGHVRMLVTVLASYAADAAAARRVAAHELGHVLGIARHSPGSADLMASPPLTDRPDAADIATVLALYHTPATVVP